MKNIKEFLLACSIIGSCSVHGMDSPESDIFNEDGSFDQELAQVIKDSDVEQSRLNKVLDLFVPNTNQDEQREIEQELDALLRENSSTDDASKRAVNYLITNNYMLLESLYHGSTMHKSVFEVYGEHGLTPLHLAATKNCVQSLEIVLNRWHPNVDVRIKHEINGGRTPLHLAAMCGNLDSVELLLTHGADVDAHDDQGNTPLHLALIAGKNKAATMLIKGGADKTLKNNQGESPTDFFKQIKARKSTLNSTHNPVQKNRKLVDSDQIISVEITFAAASNQLSTENDKRNNQRKKMVAQSPDERKKTQEEKQKKRLEASKKREKVRACRKSKPDNMNNNDDNDDSGNNKGSYFSSITSGISGFFGFGS